MEAEQHKRLEGLLYGLHLWENPSKRMVFLANLLRGHDIWLDLKYQGSQREVAAALLEQCEAKAAKLLRGHPPICALLTALRNEYGSDLAACAEIDCLKALLCIKAPERPRETWKDEPYRGLPYFDRRHAPIFFGRKAELQGLIDAMETEQGQRFLIVVGASGSGKSSLVRAGLWAQLELGQVPQMPGSERWLITAMTPTDMDSPMVSLRAATVGAIREHDGFEDLRKFNWNLALAGIEQGKGSLAAVSERLLANHPESRWLLILDQMEELFTAVDAATREAFIEQLIDATKPPAEGQAPRLQVLATLRADFFHHCVAHPSLRLVIERGGQFPLGPPDRLSLEDMVTGPLTEVDLLEKDKHGNWVPVRWGLDPGLASRIAADAAEREGGLALMAFALQELYRRSTERRHLDLDSYRSPDFGGLSGAIARRADSTLRELGEGAEAVLKRVFASLVHIGEDDAATRRREYLATWDGDPEARRLLDAFIRARLLVAGGGEKDQATVEVAHEALLREWSTLKDWINERRDAFLLRDRIVTEAQAWIDGDPRWHARRPWPVEMIDEMRDRLIQAKLVDQAGNCSGVAELLTQETDWLLAELCCDGTTHRRRWDIGLRLAEIGDPRPGAGVIDGVPDIRWRPIPPGEVEIEGHGRYAVQPFRISAYPITFAQFRAFLDARDGYDNDDWWSDLRREERSTSWDGGVPNHPVTWVSWYDATAFCRWLAVRLDLVVRLPDDREWQWAAQSARKGFVYPWGGEWQESHANTEESDIGRTTAVGLYPNGASVQGVLDLAGNVWEWCRNQYEDPRKTTPGRNGSRVLRGGSWDFYQHFARAAYRDANPPHYRSGRGGFRVLCASPIR